MAAFVAFIYFFFLKRGITVFYYVFYTTYKM